MEKALALGADANAAVPEGGLVVGDGKDGLLALHLAVGSTGDALGTVTSLLVAGADPTAREGSLAGHTAVTYAIFLDSGGAILDALTSARAGAVDVPSREGATAAQYAALMGRHGALGHLLLHNHADLLAKAGTAFPHVPELAGGTVLHAAVLAGRELAGAESLRIVLRAAMVRGKLADLLNHEDAQGLTALERAIEAKDKDLISPLERAFKEVDDQKKSTDI